MSTFLFAKTNKEGFVNIINNNNRYDHYLFNSAQSYDGSSDDVLVVLWSKTLKKYHLLQKFPFLTSLTYDEGMSLGKTLQPDREIEDIDGKTVSFSFDMGISEPDVVQEKIYEGAKINETDIVCTELHDLLKVVGGYVAIKHDALTTVKVPKVGGGLYEMNSSNCDEVLIKVLDHVNSIQIPYEEK